MAQSSQQLKMLKGYELYALRYEITQKLATGKLTYDEAMEEVEPILAEQDRRGAEIASRHGTKYIKQSRIGALR